MTTLETRRERADMLEVYKIIKGIEEIEFKDFFDMSKDTLRGHKYKLFKKRFHLNVGKLNFGNRVINSWNRLPDSVVQAESVNVFKNELDHYLEYTRGMR